MSFTQTLLISLQSLSGNKLRSALTVLGIVIGVAAVIAMLGIGRGAQASITANITLIGTTPDYALARNASIDQGDFIADSQVTGRSLVAVLGATVAVNLFG